MKKIISFLLLACLVLSLAACGGPAEKDYNLAVGMEVSGATGESSNGKISATVAVVVTDADGKIVSCRIDTLEHKVYNGEALNLTVGKSKMELGDDYGMATAPKGNWYKQAQFFETYVAGKTEAEVSVITAEDEGLKAGCTMASSIPAFVGATVKALKSATKVAFKTAAESFTVGAKLSAAAKDATKEDDLDKTVTLTYDVAGVVMADNKVAAAILDTAETNTTVAENDGALTATAFAFNATKREQGDNYVMPAGNWFTQADAYAGATVGMTVSDIASLATEGIAGCTMKNTVFTYKANLEAAAKAAR